MSSQGPPPSSLPSSMGPGARPNQPGTTTSPGALLQEVIDIRKTYKVNVVDNSLNVSYEIDGQSRYYSLPFEKMPISGLAKTLCFGRASASKLAGFSVIDAIRGAENMTGQPLSQSEAEGFARYSVKRIQYGLGGYFIILPAAYGLAWTGRKEMKFPFMKPKAPERYLNFPNRYIPIVQGGWARLTWQVTRANIYAFIGVMVAGPLFVSMGDVNMMVGLYRDGRTKSVLNKMKERGGFDRINSNRSRPGQRKAQPQAQAQGDDMNPQDGYQSSNYGGGDAYGADTTFTDSSTDTGLMSDSMAMQQEAQQSQQASPQRRQPARQQPQSQSPNQQSSSSSDFFFDDASPTAGNDPDMATSAPYKRNSGGSAWSRIRRGNANVDQSENTGLNEPAREMRKDVQENTKRRDGMEMSGGNSFSFSNSDEEKQLAKQQAQRDFDAMLDRERKESGSADYTKGMQAAQSGSEESGAGGGGGSAWERRRGG